MPELRLHGPPGVALDDGRVLPLSAREAALLAWLHLEGATPRGRIAGLLWPSGTEAQARANLRQTLARLKRAAGELLAEGEGTLRLAERVAVAAAGGARLLGPLEFDGAPELAEWLAARREAGQRDHLRAGLAAARERLAAGDLDGALAESDALLALDPAIEEAHRVRMEAFYLRDDRAAAVAAWDACRDALRAAFGIAPSAATNELGRLILARDAAPAAPGRTRTLPAALRRPPHLVGRAALMAEVRRALALGRSVVVAGVGGIGKSRLLAEVIAPTPGPLAGREPSAAISVGARPGDELLPGAVVRRLLARALERYTPPLDEATRADLAGLTAAGARDAPALKSALDQRRWFASLARAFAACHARGLRLVMVDDLQFADELSVAGLHLLVGRWLAQRDAGATAGVDPDDACQALIGARADELRPAAAALVAMLERSGRGARFDLAPLGEADVRALLDDLPLGDLDRHALAAALLAQVGGNPAFLLESLKSLWLDGFDGWRPGRPLPVPATLLDAVRQRLQRLPEEALHVAQLAAVARSDFTPAMAAAALGRTPLQLAPVLAALEATQIFLGAGFAHDLVAEAVLRSLPAALLPPLHRLVAEHLGAHDGAPAAIAHHWVAAGDRRAAAPWQLRAAQRARAAWQMSEASDHFAAAAEGLAPQDEAARLAAWLGAARCALWSRRHDEAQALLDRARPLARTHADHARWLAQQTACHFNAHRVGDAVREAEALIDALDAEAEALDPATLADGLRVITSSVPYGVDGTRALALVPRVRERLERGAEPLAERDEALLTLRVAHGGLLHWAARPLEALAELDAAWAATRAERDGGTRVLLGNQRMRVLHGVGELEAAIACGEVLLREAEPLEPGVVFLTDVMHVVAMMEIAAGRAAAGIARFDALLERVDTAGEPVPDLFVTSRALACMALGRLDEASAWLARHPPAGRDGMGLQDLGYHLTCGRLAWLRGESADRWLDLGAQAGALPPGIALQREVVLASMRAPRRGDAAARATLADGLQRRGQRGLERVARVAAARAALAAGDRGGARAQIGRALELVAQVDAWVDEPAGLWLAAAEVLAGCGDEQAAAAAARSGAEWVQGGAAQWSQPAEREAWLAGHPVHRALLEWAAREA